MCNSIKSTLQDIIVSELKNLSIAKESAEIAIKDISHLHSSHYKNSETNSVGDTHFKITISLQEKQEPKISNAKLILKLSKATNHLYAQHPSLHSVTFKINTPSTDSR